MDSPTKPRCFFKIIVSKITPHSRLMIPRKFMTAYGDDLADFILLQAPACSIWQVKLERSNSQVWLQNGWPDFAAHYSICFGHLLVFRYEGNSQFHVIIMDKSATEVEYPLSAASRSEAEHAGVLASAKAFRSKNPFFKIKMCHSYVCGRSLAVPMEFFTTRLTWDHCNVILQLSDGRAWLVKCRIYRTAAKFSSGWRIFAQANGLAVGDVCVFELINCSKKLINVSIFPGNKRDEFLDS